MVISEVDRSYQGSLELREIQVCGTRKRRWASAPTCMSGRRSSLHTVYLIHIHLHH